MDYRARIFRELQQLGDLPPPTDEAIAHSEKLDHYLRHLATENGGTLFFDEFMEAVLYAPQLGYYEAGATKFGPAGDFVTAPEISSLFGACLAHQIIELFKAGATKQILEFGAGSGALAESMLAELALLDALPDRYLILERSADLSARQAQRLASWQAKGVKVEWLSRMPSHFNGLIVANEVLDAMAVKVWRYHNNTLEEQAVEPRDDGWQKVWHAPSTSLQQWFSALPEPLRSTLPDGYTSEANLQQDGWIRTLGAQLNTGAILVIDYGFPQHEYYHPQRPGTLMCHYRHHAHSEPTYLLGLQDITAHIDFTSLAKSASAVDLTVAGYIDQANFLTNCGLTNIMTRKAGNDLNQMARLAQQAKLLLLPSEMGELFKVMMLTKNLPQHSWLGFMHGDRRHRL